MSVRWPTYHKISDIFFCIRVRILNLVSTYSFLGSKNLISMHVKIDLLKVYQVDEMAAKMADVPLSWY